MRSENIFHSKRGSIIFDITDVIVLRDGRVLTKPKSSSNEESNRLPAMATSDIGEEMQNLEDDEGDEEFPSLDDIQILVIHQWILPSEKSVKDIFAENMFQHAEVLKNKENIRTSIKLMNLQNVYRRESFCPLSRSSTYEKGRCDIRFLSSTGMDIGEWEFSARTTPAKAIGNRGRSARVNQNILNGMLRLDLTKEQLETTKVPFLQISGVYGQMLVEDLVNGYYVVFPGPTFELPIKLSHIKKLRTTLKIFKYVLVINNTLCELDHGYNPLNNNCEPSHYKSTFIHDPWWTPKKNISSQFIDAFKEMQSEKRMKYMIL
ncbi:761_t:CDS:2 [Diversispora eburnea]|uniref:761_t:CDS:1 n=1 Tax=Diversispora eburnea TaxID=1213867 RepID=A0A9N8V332_9GLOM|nr:761_t:CDS:2 [Diversispora eburnea]